jgi:hypothetical protein
MSDVAFSMPEMLWTDGSRVWPEMTDCGRLGMEEVSFGLT